MTEDRADNPDLDPDLDRELDRELDRDLDPDLDLDPELDAIATRLVSERPVPRAAFRGDLRRHLTASRPRPRLSRRRALALAGSYAGAGVVLLTIAAIGLAGAGPFAA